MRKKRDASSIFCVAVVLGLFCVPLNGHAAGDKQPAAGTEVTLVGAALNNTHLYEKEKYVFFQAFAGTPEIKAEFDKIMAEYYPEKGLDADAARKLQEQIMTRLKYYVDGPLLDELWKKVSYSAPIMAVSYTHL